MSKPEIPPRPLATSDPRPLLLVDIDGVVSLFGFPRDSGLSFGRPAGASSDATDDRRPAGSFHWIDGIPHFLSAAAGPHLLALGALFELVWCSGWEERADEYLPALLGLPAGLPFLRFGETVRASAAVSHTAAPASPATRGHWKLAAIDAHAGSRPLAWIDDCLDAPCREWAAARVARGAPTLLVQTDPAVGITAAHVDELARWATALERLTQRTAPAPAP